MSADNVAPKSTLEIIVVAPAAPQFHLTCLLEARIFEWPTMAMYGRREGRLSGRRYAVVPAMATLVDDGLVRHLADPSGRRAPPTVAHACPPSDPCAGSDASHAWATIGSIAAAGARGPSWPTKRYVRYVICS